MTISISQPIKIIRKWTKVSILNIDNFQIKMERAPSHWTIRFKCLAKHCGQAFATRFELDYHERHNCVKILRRTCRDNPCVCLTWDPRIDRSQPQLFDCEHCRRKFNSRSELIYHQRHKCGMTPYLDDFCLEFYENDCCNCNPIQSN